MFRTKTKPTVETAVMTLVLSEQTKTLLKTMTFPEIPEGATHVAFFEDGQAVFLDRLEMPAGRGRPKPHFNTLLWYEGVQVQTD